MAAKKVILSTEEVIDPGEIRQDPARTTIPYFLVDAVVHLPFGAYPGGVPARYELDLEHIDRLNAIQDEAAMQAYLEEYVYGVPDHETFLERKVGWPRLKELIRRATVREGYH
ncbi:MAG: hypothetical protein HYY54_03620 [candidate division NC10 bacterium]|nr:hypothetical protein [candidate division NC10 bacterium]